MAGFMQKDSSLFYYIWNLRWRVINSVDQYFNTIHNESLHEDPGYIKMLSFNVSTNLSIYSRD